MVKLGQYLQNYMFTNGEKIEFNGENIESKGTLKPSGTITKFGIKAKPGTKITVDGNEIVIGNSGIFEADNVVIKTISVDPTASQVMINYLYETEEI